LIHKAQELTAIYLVTKDQRGLELLGLFFIKGDPFGRRPLGKKKRGPFFQKRPQGFPAVVHIIIKPTTGPTGLFQIGMTKGFHRLIISYKMRSFEPTFLPLRIDLLEPEHPILSKEDLYLKIGRKFVLLRKKDIPLTRERIRRWKEMGVKVVYLKAEAREVYLEYLQGKLKEVLSSSKPPEEKANYLYCLSEMLTERLLRNFTPQDLSLAKGLVKETIQYLLEDKELSSHLIKLMSRDCSTYVHSNNVFLLATAFSLFQGFSKEESEKIGLGALLHDLGKERLDPRILQKPGRLDPYEWSEVRKHPIWSFEALKRLDLPWEEIRRIALEHHESNDATGYPRGLDREMIHPYSMLVKICDIFEALCGIRPYREPLTPYRALEFMKSTMLNKLDRDLFRAFIAFLGPEYYRKLIKE
jgi:HD-GYP domain-containing protein (c-di-GMP phosphodiesterase class II)